MKHNLPFNLAILLLFLVILFIPLAMLGRGGDGLVYSSIAYNMAHNIGSLWQPYYLKPFALFYDHPPLAMYFQSVFIRLLGDSVFVDKFYSGSMAVLTWSFIILCWRRSSEKKYTLWMLWLPLFLWIAIPENPLPYKDVILQATLVVFSTASVYCLICFFTLKPRARYFYFIVASGCVVIGFLVNGAQAFFPCTIFAIAWLIWRRISFLKMGLLTLCFIGLVFTVLALVTIDVNARHILLMYFKNQFLASLTNSRQGAYTGFAHLHVFQMLFNNLLPIIIIGFIFFAIRAKFIASSFGRLLINSCCNKWVYFYCLVGLAASVPVMLSTRQDSHYILQAYPWFVLAGTQVFSPQVNSWVQNINLRSFTYRASLIVFSLLILGVVTYVVKNSGKPVRDSALIKDIQLITKIVPPGTEISLLPHTSLQNNVYAYLYRYGQVSLVLQPGKAFILGSKVPVPPVISGYCRLHLPLNRLILFEKISGKVCQKL